MERREALRTAASALAVGLGSVAGAGCSSRRATGPRTPPPPGERDGGGGGDGEGGGGGGVGDTDPMAVTDLGIEQAEDGHLRVVATVTNRGDAEHTRTLTLSVTVGDETVERSREVTVAGGSKREVTVDFPDVTYDEFSGGGSVTSELT